MKLEREFEMRSGVSAVRVEVGLFENQHRPGRKELAGLLREDVAVAADFWERPVRAGLVDPTAGIGRGGIVHVMKDETPANGFAVSVLGNVVDLSHLDRGDVTIFHKTRRHGSKRHPLVGRHGLYRQLGRRHNQVRLADFPLVSALEVQRRRHVGRISSWRATVRPFRYRCVACFAEASRTILSS